jgi:hypothetical protein
MIFREGDLEKKMKLQRRFGNSFKEEKLRKDSGFEGGIIPMKPEGLERTAPTISALACGAGHV